MAVKTSKWQSCPAPKDEQWQTPPVCQGQIVLRSYMCGGDGDVLYLRIWDQNDGTREYFKRLLGADELFEPWQTEPE